MRQITDSEQLEESWTDQIQIYDGQYSIEKKIVNNENFDYLYKTFHTSLDQNSNNIKKEIIDSNEDFNSLYKTFHAFLNRNSNNIEKEYYHSSYSIRDLQGYNIVRDGAVIDYTENTSYDDFLYNQLLHHL
jgi:hypothetical protein